MRALLLALALSAGCASLPDDGALQCGGDPAQRCPSGFYCADDNRCYREGHHPDLGAGDLGPGDLANADLLVGFTPTAPVVAGDFDDGGLGDVTLGAGDSVLDTDSGQITHAGSNVRDPNTIAATRELHQGIAFHTRSGVGVFSFRSLTVPSGATLKLTGTLPAALVSTATILINGVVEARPMDATGLVCAVGAHAVGGGAPGSAGSSSPPTLADGGKGGGIGGGGGGKAINQGGMSTSGAGGGHAGTGGPGANEGTIAGGVAGVVYDPAALSPYHGGSGGGGGASPGASGGGGGGAVQLVAAQVITVGIGTTVAGIDAGGCGGRMDNGAAEAGGGGSGGAILLEAPTVQLGAMAVLAANGGGGGGADASSMPHPGQDATLGATPAYGGGTGIPTSVYGGTGGAGDTLNGSGANVGASGEWAGGGACGRIRVNTTASMPAITAGALFSPSLASGGASIGALQ